MSKETQDAINADIARVIDLMKPNRFPIAYCDYIAHLINASVKALDDQDLIYSIGKPQYDVTPEGAFASTKKTLLCTDMNGKQYKITVEEV